MSPDRSMRGDCWPDRRETSVARVQASMSPRSAEVGWAQQSGIDCSDSHLVAESLVHRDEIDDLELAQNAQAPFCSDIMMVPTDAATCALLGAIHRAHDGLEWSDHGGQRAPTLTIRTNAGRGVICVSLRDHEGRANPLPHVLSQLWEAVRSLDDLTSDVLLICLGRWLAFGSSQNSPVWVSVDQILDERGIQRKRSKREPGNWQHGHRTADRIAVGRALAQLDGFWLEIDAEFGRHPRRGRSKNLQLQSKALSMIDKVVATDGVGNHSIVKARVMPGDWIKHLADIGIRQRGILPRRAIQYDPYHERPEKRLSKYLALHFRVNARSMPGPLPRRASTLLAEAGIVVDNANPQRVRDRLERTLDRLSRDGVIDGWRYRAQLRLPARGWHEAWMGATVLLSPTSSLARYYSRISR